MFANARTAQGISLVRERERAGCVQDVAQFRVGDGRWRLKLVGQLSSGRNLDKEFA